jgi:hypothetical protein
MSTDDADKPPPLGHNSRAAGVGDIPVDLGPRVLLEILGELADGYISRPEPTCHDMRFAAHQALTVTIQFMESRGAGGLHVAVLQRLLTDLNEISQGRRVRWLEPNVLSHRPPGLREDVAVLRGCYAGVVEVLTRTKPSIRDAARAVFQKIPKTSVAFAGIRDRKWDAVKRWRDECTGKVPASTMKTAYERLLVREETHPGAAAAFLENPHTNFLRDPT